MGTCPGKNEWPELVGEIGNVAAETIKKENANVVDAIVVPEGSGVIADYRCDRVWVWVDCHGLVFRPPKIG